MSIEDRNLKPGTVLKATYRKKEYRCDVAKGEGDKLVYRVSGKEYTSPSAAGSAVMGGVACNGWRFWTVEGTEKPKRERMTRPEGLAVEHAPKAKSAPKAKAATKPAKPATKAKNPPKTTKRAPRPKKVAGGSNGEASTPVEEPAAPVEKPVNCGDCGQEFPTSHEAADHMRDAHNSPEAAGSGGR
jgi:hypothetical protein